MLSKNDTIRFNDSKQKTIWDSIFSNFGSSPMVFENVFYPTVEHAYQAQKTTDLEARMIISRAESAGKAKRLGKALVLRDNWEKIKFEVMCNCLRKKFKIPHYREMLLMSGSAEIVEVADAWDDCIWGIGKKGKGQNLLGKALMKIRNEILEAKNESQNLAQKEEKQNE